MTCLCVMLVQKMPSCDNFNNWKKCVVISVVVGVVVVVILALGLGLGLTDGAPQTDHLLRRIDCYPEVRWGRGVVDRRDCEHRGCEYDPDPPAVDAAAPVCFVSADSVLGAGYSLKKITERQDGFTATLHTNTVADAKGTIQPLNAVLDVEYAGENVLHLKVIYAFTAIGGIVFNVRRCACVCQQTKKWFWRYVLYSVDHHISGSEYFGMFLCVFVLLSQQNLVSVIALQPSEMPT